MKTEQVQLALAIACERSITKAAEALSISQPSASNMLKSLEMELGFELFERTRAGALPTDAGMEFLEYARSIDSSLRSIERINRSTRCVSLKIVSGGDEVGERAFERLCESHLVDGCSVRLSYLIVSSSKEAKKMVYEGDGDVAISLCREDLFDSENRCASDRRLGIARLCEYPLEFTCHKDSPLIQNGSIVYDLLGEYPCFTSVSTMGSEPYISYQLAKQFSVSGRTAVIGHGGACYRLLKKTSGYLVSSPVSGEAKQRYGLVSVAIGGSDVVAHAVFCKDPQKEELVYEYLQHYREIGDSSQWSTSQRD